MTYSGKSIEVLEGLDPVRARPGMYTDTERPNHLLQEVIDNAVDEALAGHANCIDVEIFNDHSYKVTDNGRGIPVDIHPEKKIPAIELILSTLHSGGKFSQSNYKFSGGLHGVGISVVTALCKKIEVKVKRNQSIWQIIYENAQKTFDLKKIGTCPKGQSGTSVHFHPDESFFHYRDLSLSKLTTLLEAKALLCRGLKVNLSWENQQRSWNYENGLKKYFLQNIQSNPIGSAFEQKIEQENQQLELILIYSENKAQLTKSYVNLIPTVQGGSHVNALKSALTQAMRDFCKVHQLSGKTKITSEDVCLQLNFILSVKTPFTQFIGQTKEKLNSPKVAKFVESSLRDCFHLWLNRHIDNAKKIAAKILENALLREKRQNIERKKPTKVLHLPTKLSDCTVRDLDRSEIFFS